MPLSPMYPPQERREEAPPSEVKVWTCVGVLWLLLAAVAEQKAVFVVPAVASFLNALAYKLRLRLRNRVMIQVVWFAIVVAFWF